MKTFTHPESGEVFQVKGLNSKTYDWYSAIEYASRQEDGWRLPSIGELEAIYDQLYRRKNGAYKKTIYWSATEFDKNAAWYYNFERGIDGTAFKKLSACIVFIRKVNNRSIEDVENKKIVFGDIHGCYKAAESAVSLAEKLRVQAVFLGDYIDRGPSGIKTIQSLISAKTNHPDWIFLMGNHEQMLLDLIKGIHKPGDIGKVLNGSEYDYAQSASTYEEWKQLDNKKQEAFVRFIESTELYYETNHVIFVHAILRDTGQALNQKAKEELIWNYDYEPRWQGKKFVHGHLNTDSIGFINQGLNINTSCGYGGLLTGLLIDSAKPEMVFSICENGVIRERANFI